MQALWDEVNRLLAPPSPATLYALGGILLLLLIADVCLQALPLPSLRRKKTPVKPVAVDGRLIAFAPTRLVHHAPLLFAIGYHLVVVGLLAGLWVALAYRDSCVPLLEALLLMPAVPRYEPGVAVAVLACAVLIWSGFRFRSLWSVSLAGFVLLDVVWMFFVAWVSDLRPLDRLEQGYYPDPGLARWARQAWEHALGQRASPAGFLVLGTGLFLIAMVTVYLSFRQPRAKRKRLFSIAYVPGARRARPRRRPLAVEAPAG
jgi:hypothetical protein